MSFADDIVLIDESISELSYKLELWREARESNWIYGV